MKKRNILIIGNWKLNGSTKIINNFCTILNNRLRCLSRCRVAIAPPIPYLNMVGSLLSNSVVKLCAQNVDTHIFGAFTGDISAAMLYDLNVQYVLIGHSERRNFHNESDVLIANKFSVSKKIGLVPILCIGENQKEHDLGATQSVCMKQIDAVIQLLGIESLKNTIIAYEPEWAIGQGVSAMPKDVQDVHKFIRNYISGYDVAIANQILIQYGGSVTSSNVIDFINQADIDGVLIGSASLNVESFLKIIDMIECM